MAPPPPRQTLPAHIRPSMPSAGALHSTSSRGPSMMPMSGSTSTNGASSVLLARLNEKKAELANLQELKALSATLAGQMQTLEEKLRTLSNGAEAVALVLSNWHDILRAISMASSAVVAKPKEQPEADSETPLPQTLVRIPVHEMDQVRAKEAAE